MSFKATLAADFTREYNNIEFLWKQRPGIGGVAALLPAASQIPGKYLCFLATDKPHVDPENLVLSLTRLRDFLVESGVNNSRFQCTFQTEDDCMHGSCMH